MSVAAGSTAPSPSPSPLDHPFRISIATYNQMIQSGVLREKDPVYLWEGQLVTRMTKGRRHVVASVKLDQRLGALLPAGWHVEQEQPIEIGGVSMPEPDLMVVRGTVDDYVDRSPNAGDVGLIVEVSETSLAEDRGEVLRAYARDGVPVYWIVNLPERQFEVYTDPTGPAAEPTYRSRRIFDIDQDVPMVLDGNEVGRIAVREILTRA